MCECLQVPYHVQHLNTGELYAQIQHLQTVPLPVLKIYAAQMVAMLQCLHSAGVVHRDVKPENLMINARGHLVLVDFGSARWLHGDGSTPPPPAIVAPPSAPCHAPSQAAPSFSKRNETIETTEEERGTIEEESGEQKHQPKHVASFVGTAEYTAPETLAGQPPSPAVDLWALGCVLFQMLTGAPPFKGPTEFATFERITSGDFALPDGVDADAADVVRRLLVPDPEARLSLAALRAHPLFTGVQWEGLWDGEAVAFVPPEPSSPVAEATDWELLSLQSLAEALPVPQYEYEMNPKFSENK